MKKISLFLITSISFLLSNAQERPFARTFASTILHKGHVTIELLHTSRFGHADEGTFHAMDQYLEIETGVANRLQASFNLSRFQTNSNHLDNPQHQSNEIGYGTEWKWRINSYDKRTGLAAFGGFGLKVSMLALESRFIIDRTFGKNLLAFNAGYEYELEMRKEEEELHHKKLPLEFDLAYMHHFSHSFGAGIELVDCNDMANGHWNNSVLFAGPTINYRTEHWFIVANYLPQLANLHQTHDYPAKRVLTDHEKSEARVIVGFSF